jgi:hypothetical protein
MTTPHINCDRSSIAFNHLSRCSETLLWIELCSFDVLSRLAANPIAEHIRALSPPRQNFIVGQSLALACSGKPVAAVLASPPDFL